MAALLSYAGTLLRQVNPSIPELPDSGSKLRGSWYLSPEQHIVEMLVHNLIMLPGLYVLMKNAKWTVVLARKPPAARAKWAHWDHVMSGMLVLAVLLQFVYKAANGRLAFMLQPCHVMTGFLAVIAELPAHHRRFDEWFNIYLHLLYAPFLALLFPDVRDLVLFGEVPVFFWHHSLMLLAPVYYIGTGKFTVFAPQILIGWLVMYVYHVDVLTTCGMWFNANLNYMLHPPHGVGMEKLGCWYRFVVAYGCLPMCFFIRSVFMGGLLWALSHFTEQWPLRRLKNHMPEVCCGGANNIKTKESGADEVSTFGSDSDGNKRG